MIFNNRFETMRSNRLATHDKFDNSDLDNRFIEHYNSGIKRRIKVKFPDGNICWGFVGITTGWRPAFLLLRNRNQRSSYLVLDRDCLILGQKNL